jgi:hypothetical protein
VLTRSAPGAAEKGIQGVDDASVVVNQRPDGWSEDEPRNVCDLKWSEDDLRILDHK